MFRIRCAFQLDIYLMNLVPLIKYISRCCDAEENCSGNYVKYNQTEQIWCGAYYEEIKDQRQITSPFVCTHLSNLEVREIEGFIFRTFLFTMI